MFLTIFINCADRLDLVGVLNPLVQYIEYVLRIFICCLELCFLVVGAVALMEHAKGAYIVVL